MAFLPYLPHPEWLAIALAVGLYLYEAASLLYSNEFLLVRQRGGWRAEHAGRAVHIGGKGVHLPAPCRMFSPAYRLAWNMDGATGPQPAVLPAALEGMLPPVRWYAVAASGLLLLTGWAALAGQWNQAGLALLAFYAATVLCFAWLAAQRRHYGFSAGQLAGLAFEILCCPPFAPNLPRRLTLALPISADGLAEAGRLLDEASWAGLLAHSAGTLQEQLDFAAAGQTPAARLGFNAFLQRETSAWPSKTS
ncbi:hypothetical protein [uncultured Aquitalea sp.]|uniref:hypothetical protein n=1 Tax=uncultured Aquitalea sp. TaxID=540272 RepID=UPI0025FE244B|nr:hypothetical protein [uncultured Aquitalea sp.]